MSADGKIALPNRKQIRLSNSQDLERVNKLRHECDAILVGIGTVIEDNPNLTIKNNTKQIENPIRVILDTNGRTPLNSNILNDEAETIIAVGKNCKKTELGNAEIIKCGEKMVDIEALMKILSKKGINKVLVEGGETVLWSFLEKRLFDEVNIFVASLIVGGQRTPTVAGGTGFETVNEALALKLSRVEKQGNGVLLKYNHKKGVN